jgi:hypothetical protein
MRLVICLALLVGVSGAAFPSSVVHPAHPKAHKAKKHKAVKHNG